MRNEHYLLAPTSLSRAACCNLGLEPISQACWMNSNGRLWSHCFNILYWRSLIHFPEGDGKGRCPCAGSINWASKEEEVNDGKR